MKFEQAFYTRGKDLLNEKEGLGIAASSRQDAAFLGECMSVGGRLNTEKTEAMAELVLYSDRTDSYVGIGISPAYNKDGGNVNKLCHIFLPEEKSLDPDAYCVQYPFRRTVEKGEQLEAVEIRPCLGWGDLPRILRKYGFDKKKLACFLSRLYPVFFREKNMMAVILDGSLRPDDDLPELAREVTWMGGCLVPKVGDAYVDYRKYLSYAVRSTENTSIVNLAYVTEDYGISNKFYFDDRPEMDVAEVYETIAEKALCSYGEVKRFFEQMQTVLDGMQEKRMDSMHLKLLYFQWKLSRNRPIRREDMPLDLVSLCRTAVWDVDRRNMLYGYMSALADLSADELSIVWGNYISRLPADAPEWDAPHLKLVLKRFASFMYGTGPEYYRSFWTALKQNHAALCGELMKEILSGNASCIIQHLYSVSSAEELIQAVRLYEPLQDEECFLVAAEEKAVRFYFQMNREYREELSRYFGRNGRGSWREKTERAIQKALSKEPFPAFMEEEMPKIEICHASMYFSLFLDQCMSLSDIDRQRQAVSVGNQYCREYEASLSGEQKGKYEKIKRKWKQDAFIRNLQGPLPSVIRMELSRKDRDLTGRWCEEIQMRVRREKPDMADLESLLLKLERNAAVIPGDVREQLREEVWEAGDDDLEYRLRCSLFFGVELFSIWFMAPAGDEARYREVDSLLGAETPENRSRVENRELKSENMQQAEFNRCCYLLWNAFIRDRNFNVRFPWNTKGREAQCRSFISILKQKLLARGEEKDTASYYILCYHEDDLPGGRPATIDQYCEDLDRIREEHQIFYKSFCALRVTNPKEDVVAERITDLQLYARISDRKYEEKNWPLLYYQVKNSSLCGSAKGDKWIQDWSGRMEADEREVNDMKNEQQETYKKYDSLMTEVSQLETKVSQLQKELEEKKAERRSFQAEIRKQEEEIREKEEENRRNRYAMKHGEWPVEKETASRPSAASGQAVKKNWSEDTRKETQQKIQVVKGVQNRQEPEKYSLSEDAKNDISRQITIE